VSVEVLRCSQCAAPTRHGQEKCDYCGYTFASSCGSALADYGKVGEFAEAFGRRVFAYTMAARAAVQLQSLIMVRKYAERLSP
jgi:hypothetical protein